ncbi:MAG: SRPBCC family protein [Thermoleophilaceae bacterium]
MAKHAEQRIEIGGTPQACFDALTAYETFTDWQDAVRSCEVLTRDGSGRGEEVAFEIDAKVRTIRYRLRYRYDEPSRIGWAYLDGDVRDVDGEYLFEEAGDGATLATYRLVIETGFWVPGPIARMLTEQVMQRSVEDLRRRVEAG